MTVVCDGVTRSILPGEKSGFYAPTIFLEKEKTIDVFYQFLKIIYSSLRFKWVSGIRVVWNHLIFVVWNLLHIVS